jgi:hypothetical protein
MTAGPARAEAGLPGTRLVLAEGAAVAAVGATNTSAAAHTSNIGKVLTRFTFPFY